MLLPTPAGNWASAWEFPAPEKEPKRECARGATATKNFRGWQNAQMLTSACLPGWNALKMPGGQPMLSSPASACRVSAVTVQHAVLLESSSRNILLSFAVIRAYLL